MKNMKFLMIAVLAFATMLTSCKKDVVEPRMSPTAQTQCCPELDSVNVSVYLLDFDTMYPNVPAIAQPNASHFISPYVLTKSQGATIDSVPLSIIVPRASINASFTFSEMFTQYPTEINDLKINKLHQTTMEVYSNGTIIATFYIAKTGFYDVFENFAGATSTMCPTNSVGVADERFRVLTRM